MRTFKLQTEIELFAAGVGAVQSLFMSIHSLLERKRDFRNLLLFLFFLAITIRLTKSILWVYMDVTPVWLINLGFAAHALSGPALLLYVWYFLSRRKWSKWNLLHFVPGLLLCLSMNNLSEEGFWYAGGYHVLLFHQLAYSAAGLTVLIRFFRQRSIRVKLKKIAKIWLIALVLGTAVLQLLYFTNYILGITPYMLGPMVYLPLIYFLAFLLFKNPSLLKTRTIDSHQNIRLSQAALEQTALKLKNLMLSQKLYLNPNCTMAQVASAAKLPPYLVSYVVNQVLGQSFPDFLNTFRIEAVKQYLINPEYQNTKIASIAYDCGFNTLSSFNAAFKKNTGTTPTGFQKANLSA
ncbi:helix-turn-helix domain-containing protein [Flagellimonas myxillae]|uniref:helix-turn-helix domain-containing protein n=1 Tax=Flagellimonas myxillae TaxID=2942214 RepID=UPI00201F1CB9|nr:helix-turn-helix domain-containing protein [Muricauda myxillae]MCL6265763.1 helix-turn-helix domain-containing protein [Muricauda myxillae]